jgi:hypothetical protein
MYHRNKLLHLKYKLNLFVLREANVSIKTVNYSCVVEAPVAPPQIRPH